MSVFLKIGELAAEAGVSPRTVDYYTNLGLISPSGRTHGNYRLYAPEAADRIATIRQLESHGLPLDDIVRALTGPVQDPATSLNRLDNDLRALRDALEATGTDTHGLLAAAITRAHNLIITAIEITSHLPPS